jgi:DNA helicase-2/ATP-dependent DNA helicase PcrA
VESLDLFARTPREPKGRFSCETLAKELNEGQLAAVVHPPKPLLVVAGAGSGKTRVITYRLARLVASGAYPHAMLAVTFTNKAAAEMRERVSRLINPSGGGVSGLWIGTFHATSARLLRRYGEVVGLRKDFLIYDDDDQRRLMTRVLADLGVPERLFPVRQVLSVIDRAKNQGIDAAGFQPADYFDDVVAKAYKAYEERMAAANATDFGGLLVAALRLCESGSPVAAELAQRFDHVLVDEFQDTNSVQYRLVRFLSNRTQSITVVGDEDQSIYKWRGADIRNILDFERDHPGAAVVKLEQNYRSSGNILQAANAIIARNTERRPKRLFTAASAGAPLVVFEGETERDEAEFIAATIEEALRDDVAPRDVAVFYRTNGQSRVLEEALRTHDLPYVVVGGTRFYDRAEVKDLIAYLRVVLNPDDGVGLLRIINTPARGIGDATIERVAALAASRNLSLTRALELAAGEAGARDDGPLLRAQAAEAAAPAEELLGTGPRRKVAAFCELMRSLRAAAGTLTPAALAEKVLEESGYRDALAAEASLEAEGRLENLMELVGQMREYEKEAEEPTLAGFLEKIALASDVDGYDPEKGAISLMTVHTAKGLEFPLVFIAGLEEGVFPHQRSIDDDSAIEEERRLCYVAVTRAMKRLFLARARRRRLAGQELGGVPSRFLKDIPAECAEAIIMPRPAYLDVETDGAGPWGGSWTRQLGQRPRLRPEQSFAHGSPSRTPSRKPARPGEITVHYDDGDAGDNELGLRVGGHLSHPSFGVGEVRAWQGSGADLKVTIRFPKVGMKTILARFLTKT